MRRRWMSYFLQSGRNGIKRIRWGWTRHCWPWNPMRHIISCMRFRLYSVRSIRWMIRFWARQLHWRSIFGEYHDGDIHDNGEEQILEITKITEIDNKRHIALLNTFSISFMQGLQTKGLQPEAVLKIMNEDIIFKNPKMGVKYCKYRHRKFWLTARFTTHFARQFIKFFEEFCKMVKSTVAGNPSKYKCSRIYERIYKHDFDTFCVLRQ